MAEVSKKIGAKPFMEYAQSYALYNYNRIDKNKGLEYENLQLVRRFSGMKSEDGFILVLAIYIGTCSYGCQHW
jgi:indoleamine 2,3-dioxygenase